MATEQANVVYTADTSQYNRSMAEAIATTEKYASVVDNTAGKIAKAGIGISRLIMQGGPFGAGKMMSPAVEVAAQYEQQLSLVGARAKVAGGNINQLGRDVRGLAREFPIGIGGAVQQFEQLQRAGKSGDELKKLTQEMTKLGAATGEMGGSLTQGMIQFTRSFDKFDPKNVTALGDSVTKMSSQFGASATSIVDFSNAVAPLGKTLGMSATDVIGFGTAFSRAGEDGYRAMNVFSKMLADMERSTRTGAPTVRGYAEAIGMTSEQFNTLVQTDPTEAMTRFIEAIGSKGKDGIRILEDLGLDGVRSMKSIQNVAASGDIREMTEQAAKALGSGAMETGSKEAFDGLTDSLNKTSESMNQLVEASAKPMLGMMGGLAEKTATVTSGFAKFAQSEGVQTATQIMMMAGGGLGLVKLASTLAAAKGIAGLATTGLGKVTGGRFAGFVTSPGNAGMLRQGGMLGIGAGLMTGNPMLAALGAASMFIGPGMTRLQAMEARGATGGGMMRRAGSMLGYGGARVFDMFYGGAGATERWRDIARGQERGGAMYGRQMTAMQRVAFGRGVIPFGADLGGGMYSPERQKFINEANRAEMKRIWGAEGTAAERRALTGRMLMAAPGTAARGLGSTAAGIGSLAGGLIGMPLTGTAAMLGGAAVGVGALGIGAYMAQKQIKQAKEGPTALEELATKTGIAAKGMEKLAETMAHLEANVGSVSDAMKITATDIEAAGNVDYEAAWKVNQERSAEQIAAEMTAMFGAQSPEAIQRAKTDLLSQVKDEDEAAEIMKQFGENVTEGFDPFEAANIVNKANESGWDTFLGNLTGWSPGKNEAIRLARSAGQNAQAAQQDYAAIYGPTAAAAWTVQTQLPKAYTAAAGATDEDVQRAYIEAAAPGIKKEEIDQVINSLKPGYGRKQISAGQAAVVTGTYAGGYGSAGTKGAGGTYTAGGVELEKGPVGGTKEALEQTDYYKRKSKELNDLASKTTGSLQTLIEAGTPGPVLRDLKSAIDIASKSATEGGPAVPLPELLAEFDKAKAEGKPGTARISADEAAAIRAVFSPENIGVQQSAFEKVVSDQRARLQAGATGTGLDIRKKIADLEQWRLDQGEIDPATLAELGREIDASMEAIVREAPGRAKGQTQVAQLRAANEVAANFLKTGSFSQEAEIAKREAGAVETIRSVESDLETMQYEMLTAEMNRQKQAVRQQDDMNRQLGNMNEDAARNERRMKEDHNRQKAYADADFRKSQLRAEESFNRSRADAQADYDKQMIRAKDDFNKQMRRSEDDYLKGRSRAQDDYNKQVTRANEDFAKQQRRQAEEIARSMLDPFSRVNAQRTWGTGGLIGNLEQQNKFVKEQLDVVDALRERGLSQDVIDTLKMTDANNAMQVRSMSQMTDEEIRRLNEEVGERFDLGERLASPENNLGIRQAEEDFRLSMERMAEDFALSMQRGAEDFALSQARAIEDFNLSTIRSGEDFQTSMDRSLRDFTIQMQQSTEDYHTAMARQDEAFKLSLARMYEDIAWTAGRMREEFAIQAARAKEDIMNAYNELYFPTEEDRDKAINTMFEGGDVAFKGYIKNTMQVLMDEFGNTTTKTSNSISTTVDTNTGKVETSAEDMDEATSDALGNVKTNAEDAFGTVKEEGVDAFNSVESEGTVAMDTLNGKIDDARLAFSIFFDTVKTNAAAAMTLASNTAVNVLAIATNTLNTTITNFEKALGDYAWLFRQDAKEVKKELVLKFDQESFDKTFGAALGDADLKKPGYQVPDYGAGRAPARPGGGPVLTGTAAMHAYSGFFNARLGDSTMIDTRNGKSYPVQNHCLRNACEGWIQGTGNDVKHRLPTAAAHANLVKGQMQHGPAPEGALYWWNSSIGGGAGHVAIADGRGNAMNNWGGNVIEINPVASMSPKAYMGWTSPHTSLYKGAVVRGTTHALVGEAGPEAVLPLNESGMGVLNAMLEKYSQASGVREQRTAAFSVDHSTHNTSIYNDSSVHTGPVTVVSDNADRMAEQLRARQRRERLASKV